MVHIDITITPWKTRAKAEYRDPCVERVELDESIGKEGVLIHLVSDAPHVLGVSVTPQLWAVINLVSVLGMEDQLSFIAAELGRIFALPGNVSIDLSGVPEPPVV